MLFNGNLTVMQKNHLLFILVGVALLILSAMRFENKKEIAVLLPLSSDFAWWGETVVNSIKIAQTDGYLADYQFNSQDTKCNGKDAVGAVQNVKATNPDLHLFVVGCDNDVQAILPFLDKEKDLVFVVGLSGSNLYNNDFKIINLAHRLEDEAQTAADYAINNLHAKRASVITDNGTFGRTLADSFISVFKKTGQVMSDNLSFNQVDINSSILKAVNFKPDVVYLQNDIPGLTNIIKKLKALNYRGNIVTYYGGHDQQLINNLGGLAEGLMSVWVTPAQKNQEYKKFSEQYVQRYGQSPFISAFFSYDGMKLLDRAVQSCHLDASCIKNYFYAQKDFIGTLGQVQYLPRGEVKRNFLVEKVVNGVFVN